MDLFCENCSGKIVKPKPRQRFCCANCRAAWHDNNNRKDGITAKIKSVNPITSGEVSMVLRFPATERARLVSFLPGMSVKVIE
jgi:hypothetical protein